MDKPALKKPPLKGRLMPSEEGIETNILGQQEGVAWDPVESFSWGVSGAIPGAAVGSLPGAVGGFGAGFLGDMAAQIVRNQVSGLPWWLGFPAEVIAAIKAGKLGAKIGNLIPKGKVPLPPPPPVEAPRVPPRTSSSPTPVEWHAPPHPLEEAAQSTIPAGPKRTYQVGRDGELIETSPRVPGETRNVVEGQWPNVTVKKRDIPAKEQSSVEGQWPNVRLTKPVTASPWEEQIRLRKGAAQAADEVLPTPPAPKAPKAPKEPKVEPGAPTSAEIAITAATAPKGSVWKDVSGWTRVRTGGLGEGMSYLASPILSVIERVAGPNIGKQITALEGAKSAREAKIWTELFGNLTDNLRHLPKQLHRNFVDTLEGKATAETPLVEQLVGGFRQVFGPQGTALLAQQSAGLKVKALENYFMHEFEPAFVRGLINDPARKVKVIEDMVSAGVAMNKAEARVMLRDYLKDPSRGLFRDFRTGAEFKRTKNHPEYIIDPVRAVSLRGRNIARRLAELEVYGAKKANLRSLTTQLEPDAMARTMSLIKLLGKRDPIEQGLSKTAQTAMSFNAVTSLSLAFLMNMSQPSLLALRTSIPNMAKGVFSFLSHPKQSWMMARELGIYADMAQRVLMQEMTGGVGGWLSRRALVGFNISEKFVRAMAAEAGKDWAKNIQKQLQMPKDVGRLTRELNNLNFTPQEIKRLFTTKTLTPKDVELIQWSIADQVSFLPRTARKSEFYLTTPIGPVILQFKNFLMNTGRLLKQTIFDEWRAGNKIPALRAIGVVFPTMAAAGELPADLNTMARGSKRPVVSLDQPSTLLWRALDNVSQIGALGLGLGLIQEMTGLRSDAWKSDLSRFVVGPTVTAMGEELQHPGQMVRAMYQGDTPEAQRQFYESLRRVTRRMPYAGPLLANQVLPSSAQSLADSTSTWQDRLGWTQRALEEKKLQELRARLRHLRQR